MTYAARRNYETLKRAAPRCWCGNYVHRDSKPSDVPGWMGPACNWAPLDEVVTAERILSLPPAHELHHQVRQLFGLPCDKACREPKPFTGESLIARIKAAYRLEDIAERLTRLYGTGNVLSGRCPLHGEQKGRAFTVWVDEQKWKCFGKCGLRGDVIDLVRECKSRGIDWRGRDTKRTG